MSVLNSILTSSILLNNYVRYNEILTSKKNKNNSSSSSSIFSNSSTKTNNTTNRTNSNVASPATQVTQTPVVNPQVTTEPAVANPVAASPSTPAVADPVPASTSTSTRESAASELSAAEDAYSKACSAIGQLVESTGQSKPKFDTTTQAGLDAFNKACDEVMKKRETAKQALLDAQTKAATFGLNTSKFVFA